MSISISDIWMKRMSIFERAADYNSNDRQEAARSCGMKVFLSVVLYVMLCIQPVLAQEDTEAGEEAESEMTGSAEEQEGAKTQEDDQVEETRETKKNSEKQQSD